MDGMLVLAGLSVVIAAIAAALAFASRNAAMESAKEARRSADAAEKGLELDLERRWAELEPLFEAEYVELGDSSTIELQNRGQMDYTLVAMAPALGQTIITAFRLPGHEQDDAAGWHRSGPLGPFERGESKSIQIRRTDEGGIVTLVLDVVRASHASWQTTCDVNIPPKITPAIY